MPILFMLGLALYFLGAGVWFLLKLPFLLIARLFQGVFMLLVLIFQFFATLFGNGYSALFSGDASVVGAKLLTVGLVIVTIIYLIANA